MKALDTPVLLELLRGGAAARGLAEELGAEEVATTEINLWELGVLAVADSRPGRARRLEALERLRRKLTVLPIDGATTAFALRRGAEFASHREPPLSTLLLATLAAHGVEELVTARAALPLRVPSGLRLTLMEQIKSKKRK